MYLKRLTTFSQYEAYYFEFSRICISYLIFNYLHQIIDFSRSEKAPLRCKELTYFTPTIRVHVCLELKNW